MQRNSDIILTEWLVLNTQSGNANALEQLLKLWYPKFLRYAQRQLKEPEAAQDVVQDALLAITRRIRKLKDPGAFPKWAYQILHRRGVDHIRKEIRAHRHEPPEDSQDAAHSAGASADSPIDTTIDINKALGHLNEASYLIVHLHYLEGLTLKEIAAIIAIPVGTVKSRLHTARTQLKQIWKNRYD